MFNLTKADLLNKQSLFLNDFSSVNDVVSEFQYSDYARYDWEDGISFEEALSQFNSKYKILYADYTYEDYSGDSYVLGYDVEKDMFFEVHGGHCSCYGLEGQWDTEYVDISQLNTLLNKRDFSEKKGWWYSRSAYSSKEFKNWLKGE